VHIDAVRPSQRGRLHGLAFLVAVPAGVALVANSHRAVARAGAVVYAVTLLFLFGTSAAYHLLRWGRAAHGRMKRLDHSMIYVFIAGSYTPFCLVTLSGWVGTAMLVLVWAGALLGVALRVGRPDAIGLVAGSLYIALGWLVLLASPWLLRELSGGQLLLLVAGGLVYTAGAAVLKRRLPDPFPAHFGYHEVWHVMVVAAAACHYGAIWSVLSRA
jgi:hemolysin III